MKYVDLGGSGLRVSTLCLGTMTFGRQNTEEEAYEQMDYALEQGVNFFDTAEMYPFPIGSDAAGITEEIIGRWMKLRNSRDKIILATKVSGGAFAGMNAAVGNRKVPKVENAPQSKVDAENIKDAIEGSLRRLQTSYIDLYQIHWPDRCVPVFGKNQYRPECVKDYVSFEEQIQTMADLIKEGKIRHWGVSNETTFGVCKFCETAARMGLPPPISIQNEFSLVDRRFESHLAEACSPRHYNIGLLSWGTLAGGTLSGKYENGNCPEGARHTKYPKAQPRYTCPRTIDAVREYVVLAKRKNISPTQLAVAWCNSRWYVSSIVIGATKLEQIKEQIEAFSMELDEDTLAEIDQIHLKHRNPNIID